MIVNSRFGFKVPNPKRFGEISAKTLCCWDSNGTNQIASSDLIFSKPKFLVTTILESIMLQNCVTDLY